MKRKSSKMYYKSLIVEMDEFGFNSTYYVERVPKNDDYFLIEMQESELSGKRIPRKSLQSSKDPDVSKVHDTGLQTIESVLNNVIHNSKTLCPFCDQRIPGYYLRVHRRVRVNVNTTIQCPKCKEVLVPVNLVIYELRSDTHLAKNYIKLLSLAEKTPLDMVICRFKRKETMYLRKILCSACNIFVDNYQEHMESHKHLTTKSKSSIQNIPILPLAIQSIEINSKPRLKTKTIYQCDICGNTATNISEAQVHNIIHSGKSDTSEGQHRCSFCKRTYYFYKDLRKHLTVHRGEEPYKCDLCERKFMASASLTRHQNIKTALGELTLSHMN